MTNAERLQDAYQAAGQSNVVVREISPGRYEVIKARSRQDISQRDLWNEIERLNARALTPGGSVECPHCHWGIAPSAFDQHVREKHS